MPSSDTATGSASTSRHASRRRADFAVTVALPLAHSVTTISNNASVADDGANGTEPAGNNGASDTTPLTNPFGPVINEFDYDQGDPDEAEFVELYNPTGASFDLHDYELRLVRDPGGPGYGGQRLSRRMMLMK